MSKNFQERLCNVLLGGSILSWAVMGLLSTEDGASTVRYAISSLHLVAGMLILFRAPVKLNGGWQELTAALPGVISAGIVFRLAGPTYLWPWFLSSVFIVSVFWTIVSLLFLGRSFAIFPAIRTTKTKGPFAVVRHPAYLGELGLAICCVLASSNGWAWPAWGLVLATVVIRILIEERLLLTEPSYQRYAAKVRYRLVPWIW